METTFIRNWRHFESRIDRITQGAARSRKDDQLIFRGLSDARWKIESTLERSPTGYLAEDGGIKYEEYYRRVVRTKPVIESHTRERWNFDILSPDHFKQQIEKLSDTGSSFSLPLPGGQEFYSYLSFLRHYGYPSPLVDFSYSPYVALMFAIVDQTSDWSSVYVSNSHYDESIAVGDQPVIRALGRFVRTSPRHHLQQGMYLCCAAHTDTGWEFRPFESGLGNYNMQRLLIPRYAREDMLARLLFMNVTPYVLSNNALDAFTKTEWLKLEAKRSFIPNVILIGTDIDYDAGDECGVITRSGIKRVLDWLKEHSKLGEYHTQQEDRLNIYPLGPKASCFEAIETVATGHIAPLQPHDYPIAVYRTKSDKVAMAVVDDIIETEVSRIYSFDPSIGTNPIFKGK